MRRAAKGVLAVSSLGAAFFVGVALGPTFQTQNTGPSPLALAAERLPQAKAQSNLSDISDAVGGAAAAEARAAREAAEATANVYDLEVSLKDPFAQIDTDNLQNLLSLQGLPVSFDTAASGWAAASSSSTRASVEIVGRAPRPTRSATVLASTCTRTAHPST
mmetsp:Transcript_120458/g.384624  ORF Transcript_120458/g.384624 Transcript_120458/m.384624 type:complete len:162 (-) Transcript_120458:888-1373(-)